MKTLLKLALLACILAGSSAQVFSNPAWKLIQETRERMQNEGSTRLDLGYSGAEREFSEEFFTSALIDAAVPSFLKSLVTPEDLAAGHLGRINEILASISDECNDAMTQGLNNLLFATNKTMWPIHMADAWGKFPSGIFSGNTASPGDFEECLQIRGNYKSNATGGTKDFKGLYCSTYIVPMASSSANTTSSLSSRASVTPSELLELMARQDQIPLIPFLGSCFPSVCTEADANLVISNALALLNAIPGLPANVSIATQPLGCRTDEKPPFGAAEITMIVVIAIIAGLCVIGTLIDLLLLGPDKKPTLLLKIFKSFSLYDNTIKVLATKAGKDNLGCLHGLRFFSMAWVVAGHTWFQVRLQFTWNGVDAKQQDRLGWAFMTMLNPTISVDTFFVMSGLLVAYNLLKELDRTKTFKQFATLKVPMMYFHRYIRLTPTYVILLGILATLAPYAGTSPSWYIMESEAENCRNYWWHNMLYFNNLLDYRNYDYNMCYQESWYLADDMQFFILSPLIIYPLWKNAKIGLGLLGGLSILHIVGNFLILGINHAAPTFIPMSPDPEYGVLFYWKPWTRVGPYLVGIFIGWALYMNKKAEKPFTLPTWAVYVGWALNTALALAISIGVSPFMHPENYEDSTHSVRGLIYGAMHRYAWGVVIGWIIYNCVMGTGGIVDRILSWKVFMPLGRLTYCVYISSFHIQLLYHITLLHPIHFSNYIMMHTFFAHLVFTCMIGFLLTITIESPFMALQKLLF